MPPMNTLETAAPLRVYVVEDDDDLREDIVLLLGNAGFDVRGLPDAPAFYKAHALAPCEVAVLDIGLNGEDGLSLAAQLRASGPIGIVMASARGAVEERIEALRRGADVYMVKPVHIEELAATIRMLGSRVRAVMQPQPPATRPETALAAAAAPAWRLAEGDWVLRDPVGRQLKLTTNERAFLSSLMGAGGQVVNRDDLLLGVGSDLREADPKRLDVIVSRLRRKARQAGMQLPLHAVRGAGYQFVP